MHEKFIKIVNMMHMAECMVNYGTKSDPLYLLSEIIRLTCAKNRPYFNHYSEYEKINKLHKGSDKCITIYAFLTTKGVERFVNENKKLKKMPGIFEFYGISKWSEQRIKEENRRIQFLKFCKDLAKVFPDYKIIGEYKILLPTINVTLGFLDSDVIIPFRLRPPHIFVVLKKIFEFTQKRYENKKS